MLALALATLVLTRWLRVSNAATVSGDRANTNSGEDREI
jgi:hypothetical protein